MKVKIHKLKVTLISLFTFFAIAVMAVLFNVNQNTQNNLARTELVNHTNLVIQEIGEQKTYYYQIRALVNAFLVTNIHSYEQEYYLRRDQATEQINRIKSLVRDNGQQVARISQYEGLLVQRFERYELTMYFYKTDKVKYEERIAQNAGAKLNQEITYILGEIEDTEESLRLTRIAQYEESKKRTTNILGTLYSLCLVILFTAFFVTKKLLLLKEQEAVLKGSNERLEESVRQKTKELVELNESLQAFTYSVSHDLKAPLRAIEGFANVIQSQYLANLPADGQRYLEIIITNVQKTNKLISDLLMFAKVDKKEIVKTEIDLTKEFKEVVEEVRNGYSKYVEVKINKLGPAMVDATIFKQVIINLISNAFKFSANVDNPKIEVGQTLIDDKVIYYVKDNGAGFSMEHYQKLFGIFSRLHNEREFSGTGVGLSIVKRIIQKHDGNIWATSGNGETIFYFTLDDKPITP